MAKGRERVSESNEGLLESLREDERTIRVKLDRLGLIPISHAVGLRDDLSRAAIYALAKTDKINVVELLGRTFVYKDEILTYRKGTDHRSLKKGEKKLWWRPDADEDRDRDRR